jgi:hypothetical protein
MEKMTKTEKEYGGRAVVPGHCIQFSADSTLVGAPGPSAGTGPKVDLIRDGAVIKAIEISCTCGQRIRLNCVY